MDRTEQLFDIFKRSKGVTIDTRTISGGEIFFALKGENSDGNIFSASALEKGALCAVVDDQKYAVNENYFLVEDGLIALQQLAKKYRSTFDFPVLALTGSNGKTTTKELIRSVLAQKFNVQATKGNLNNHIGVPLTILSIASDCNFAIIEMGANHQKEIESYCQYADPAFGLITNIGKAHLEGFGGEEGVLKGKSELFQYVMQRGGPVFYSSGQNKLQSVVDNYVNAFTYGFWENDFVSGKIISGRTFATVSVEGVMMESNLVGDYNADNILAAVCVGKYFHLSLQEIATGIAQYFPDNNRSELRTINGNHFILDAYNANPSSMKVAIENLQKQTAVFKIAILGDMLELGEYAHREHGAVLEQARSAGFQLLVTVGPEFGKFKYPEVIHFENSTDAQSWWKSQSYKDATILLKGSRGIKLEKIIN